MWHDDDFFDREEDVSRRRRHRRRLECGCREERGEHECGCERCEGREHERGREHGREHERFERERRGRHCGSCICREIAELRKLQRVDLFLKSSEEIQMSGSSTLMIILAVPTLQNVAKNMMS